MPVGLSNKGDISDYVIAALKADGVDHAIILGGPLAVPQSVIDKLAANGIQFVTRLQGSAGNTGRSGTAAAVAQYAVDKLGFTVNNADVASGRVAGDGADALAAGPLSGKENTPLLITETESVGGAAVNYLKAHANTLQSGRIYGGPMAITNALEATLEQAAQSVTSNQSYSVTPQGEPAGSDLLRWYLSNNAGNVKYTVSGLADGKPSTSSWLTRPTSPPTPTVRSPSRPTAAVTPTSAPPTGHDHGRERHRQRQADHAYGVMPVNGQSPSRSTAPRRVRPSRSSTARPTTTTRSRSDANGTPTEAFGVGGG